MMFPPKPDMTQAYPELMCNEFAQLPDEQIHFLMFRFDPGCAEVLKEKPAHRTHKAANLAGIPADTGDLLADGKNDNFNAALTKFFGILNNEEWELYQSGRIAIAQLSEELRTSFSSEGLDEDRRIKACELKGKLYATIEDMIRKNKALLASITGGDENAQVIVKASLRPEEMAKKVRG